ncbi:MAG: GHMP kinase [Kouleothrix sp.]|nr:GHMP kinase [Kouleothrix sp.]
MWRLAHAPPHNLPDLARFLAAIERNADFFAAGAPLVVARAPGRLDLMGGIADYSGALVLQLPLGVATFVAAQASPEPRVTIRSLTIGQDDSEPEVAIALGDLAPGGTPLEYGAARALLSGDPRRHWAAYVAGALPVLAHERGLPIRPGLRLLIDSDVPAGKGVSSSAAIEVAAMRAICAIYGVELSGRELAILCQQVENLVVGAPCGVMDQMTSACGEQGRLLALLCQPAELEPPVALPAELEVWGIDSGIRHAVTGADYGSVRVGAFMGYRIIADLAGLPAERAGHGTIAVDDPRWRGYLANVAPSLWETNYRDRVPEALGGAAFLARYGGTTDRVTRVDPARTYAVRRPAAHPIYEHQRVRLFRRLLAAAPSDEEQRGLLGELMYQSHASYSACGLGSDGTDRLVELVRAAGPVAGLYGAKITGGGSGGTVAVLARRGCLAAVRDIAARYERETGRAAAIMGGSSPGAAAYGVLRLAPVTARRAPDDGR